MHFYHVLLKIVIENTIEERIFVFFDLTEIITDKYHFDF